MDADTNTSQLGGPMEWWRVLLKRRLFFCEGKRGKKRCQYWAKSHTNLLSYLDSLQEMVEMVLIHYAFARWAKLEIHTHLLFEMDGWLRPWYGLWNYITWYLILLPHASPPFTTCNLTAFVKAALKARRPCCDVFPRFMWMTLGGPKVAMVEIWGGGNMGKHGERSFEEKMVAQSSSRLASSGHSKNGILFWQLVWVVAAAVISQELVISGAKERPKGPNSREWWRLFPVKVFLCLSRFFSSFSSPHN